MQRGLEIRARCSPAERRVLYMLAERESLKPTEYIRLLIRSSALQAGLWPVGGNDARASW